MILLLDFIRVGWVSTVFPGLVWTVTNRSVFEIDKNNALSVINLHFLGRDKILPYDNLFNQGATEYLQRIPRRIASSILGTDELVDLAISPRKKNTFFSLGSRSVFFQRAIN